MEMYTIKCYKHIFCCYRYSAGEITISVDKLANKVVVQAAKRDQTGHPTRTFTQKVQLPRFADDPLLTSKLTKGGQLKLEVKLTFTFNML